MPNIQSQRLTAHGKYPSGSVYKMFCKIEYAQQFMQCGQFRMGGLHSYRTTEDSYRQDQGEGLGSYQSPGIVTKVHFDPNDPASVEVSEESGYVTTNTQLGNPIYLFCTSMSGVNLHHVAGRFGKYIVQIFKPKELADRITAHLETRPEKYAGGIDGQMVSYNKGEKLDSKLNSADGTTLSYSQKPRTFERECEFRFVAINMDPPSKREHRAYIEVDLGGPIKMARLLCPIEASNNALHRISSWLSPARYR